MSKHRLYKKAQQITGDREIQRDIHTSSVQEVTSSESESLSDKASNEEREGDSERHSSGCSSSQATSLSAVTWFSLFSPVTNCEYSNTKVRK